MSNDARSQARNGQELYFYQRGRLRVIATRLRVPHPKRSSSVLRIFYLSFRNIDKHLCGRESQVSKQTAKLLFFFTIPSQKTGWEHFFILPKNIEDPMQFFLLCSDTSRTHVSTSLASLTCIIRFLPNVANSFRENMSVSVDHSGIKWQLMAK